MCLLSLSRLLSPFPFSSKVLTLSIYKNNNNRLRLYAFIAHELSLSLSLSYCRTLISLCLLYLILFLLASFTGGCSYSPDSYYINIRTGIHYFPKGNATANDAGNNRFKSGLNRIEEKNDEVIYSIFPPFVCTERAKGGEKAISIFFICQLS